MIRVLAFVVIASTFTLVGGCKPSFKPFSSAEGKFSCEFPGSPKEQTQAGPMGVQMKMFATEESNGACMVAYADMPIPANESEKETELRLDGSREGMVSNMGGVFKSESKIKLDGKYLGREILADLPKQNGAVRARVYLVGTRLYQILVVGKKGYVDSADSTRFLDSLKLAK